MLVRTATASHKRLCLCSLRESLSQSNALFQALQLQRQEEQQALQQVHMRGCMAQCSAARLSITKFRRRCGCGCHRQDLGVARAKLDAMGVAQGDYGRPTASQRLLILGDVNDFGAGSEDGDHGTNSSTLLGRRFRCQLTPLPTVACLHSICQWRTL